MVFQRPFLLSLSVRWNVLLGLWLPACRRPSARHAPRGAAARGPDQPGGAPARELSGGQQQRLALARAWALQPDILFLDEPTASLDPSAKREVEALVLDLAADGVTLVMSTHNLGQAKRLGTRVAYLEDGPWWPTGPRSFFEPADRPNCGRQFLKGELPWHLKSPSILRGVAALALLATLAWPALAPAQDSFIVDRVDHLDRAVGPVQAPAAAFKQATGIDVRVVAVGTGQALDTGAAATPTSCSCTTRWPSRSSSPRVSRPSAATSCTTTSCWSAPRPTRPACKGNDIAAALKKLAGSTQPFVSRGDKSGTHAAELRLWKAAGVDLAAAKPAGYKECGCGMGPALNIASSPTPTCSPTAAPGCRSRTGATWASWSKATRACSTSTA
jgi:hypothetical protein